MSTLTFSVSKMRDLGPSPVRILPFFLLLVVLSARAELGPQVKEDARKVLEILDRIQVDQGPASGRPLRTVVVSEQELNAYIAYRIETEREEIMKELRLKLLPENRVEGKIFIDLSGRRVPWFLKPQMNVYFAGTLETESSKVRVRFESLFLGEQRIQTALLDLIISAVSRVEKTEAVSIEDWYDLPYGIRKIETRAGELIVSY
jgi:hypothetical protein